MTALNILEPVAVGIDVGGTKVLIGAVGESGRVYASKRYLMDRSGRKSAVASIENAAEDFMQNCWDGPAPLGIGLGVIGQTDPARGIWVQAINLPINRPVLIGDRLQKRYGLPVVIDNDVHAAVQAELHYGVGRTCKNFIYINVGTGIAAGIICDGKLIRGAGNYAGELGHMVVDTNGIQCICGRCGCLEAIASGGGILRQIRSMLPEYPGSALQDIERDGRLLASEVYRLAEQGDPLSKLATARALEGLGTALVNLINLLNPERIVLGGGVLTEDYLIARLRDYISRNALPAALKRFQDIAPTRLRVDRVGLLGAACLFWNRQKNESSFI